MRFRERRPRRGPGRWLLGAGALVCFLAVLVALDTIVSSRNAGRPSPPPPLVTPDPTIPPTVLAYFYYWYDLPNGPHSSALTHRPAEPDASYRDRDWFRKQFLDMLAAGIDIALAVYWGDAEPSSDIGLANMAEATTALRREGLEPPKIGMFLDTGAIARWPGDQRDLRQPANQERAYQMVRAFYSILPREDWGTIKGRPIVWLWGNYFQLPFDQSLFDHLSSRFTQEFGTRPYIVAEMSWRHPIVGGFLGIGTRVDTGQTVRVDQFYVWGAALNGFVDQGGVAQVGPGYDERALDGPGRSGRFRPREGGAFYRRNLEAALASGKRLLAIETWNEFHEATDIARSVEYGDQYIRITREYVDRFKARSAGSGPR